MALASALSRGDIDVAYICLIPAINAFGNAEVPFRVIAGHAQIRIWVIG